MSAPSTIDRFSPARLFPSAVDEVLFGGSAYRIRVGSIHSHITWGKIKALWQAALLAEPLGPLFTTLIDDRDKALTIVLSDAGRDVLEALSSTTDHRQLIAMSSQLKADFMITLLAATTAHFGASHEQ